jgi:penicillin G amidase
MENENGKIQHKRARRSLLIAGAGGAMSMVGVGLWQAGRARFLPKTRGVLTLPGLNRPVEVVRDKWAVPHIFAENYADLFFAQGFIQAQDRFWQMEFSRRLSAGRLAEVLGVGALPTDRYMRRLELYRTAEKSWLHIKENDDPLPLQRYAEGVNAWLALKKYPVEIALLRYQPEPWLPADSIGWLNVLTLAQSGNYLTELARAEVVRAAGTELAAKLEPSLPAAHPIIIPTGADYAGTDFSLLLNEYARVGELVGLLRAGGASNAWVVDGSRSTTGKPLLANDPHIGPQMPGTFYTMHLCAGDYDAAGATLPGVPGVLLGRNRYCAWGVTNALADTQDAFIEKLDPDNPRRYEYKGEWFDFETHWEEIKVKGQPTVRQEQFRSVHGPVVNEFAVGGTVAANGGSVQSYPVALAWSLYHKPYSTVGTLKAGSAKNWDEFRAALRHNPFPALSFVYADIYGNIGYQQTGHIPVRRNGQGLLPNPGHTGEYDWTGFLDFDDLPHAYNPPQGYIVTANNKVTDDSYPHFLSLEYLSGARAARIRQLLTAQEKFSPAEFNTMQRDRLTLNGLRFARLINALDLSDPLLKRAQTLLATWDGQLTPESTAGALYHVGINRFVRRALEPQIGLKATDLLMGVLDGSATSQVTALVGQIGPHLMSYAERGDSSILPSGATFAGLLEEALDYAVGWLTGKFGDDMRAWQWGKLHRLTWAHVLGAVQPLDVLFNRGPIEFGGDGDTIFQGAYAPRRDIFTANAGTPAWRLVADLSRLDNDFASVTGGQSGSPFSPHYADLVDGWLSADLQPLLISRDALTEQTAATLRLEPQN